MLQIRRCDRYDLSSGDFERSHCTKSLPDLLLLVMLLVTITSLPLEAADLWNILNGYSLTSWGQKDGLPVGVIWAISQDHDGYLWLGTDGGPIRFDGVRFVLWQPDGPRSLPKGPVRAVCVSHDGSIWLGFGEPGGVSRIRSGKVQNYSEADGIEPGAITMLAEDRDGDVWAGNRSGLYRFADDRWQPSAQGLPRSPIYRKLLERHGRSLVATADGLFQREPNEANFQKVGHFDGVIRDVAEDSSGRIWVADPVSGFRTLGVPQIVSHEKGTGSRLLQDSKGNLWIGTFGQGLWLVRLNRALHDHIIIQKTTTLSGFSDDGVAALLEDRNGNIWAATYDGLNRLTPHKLTPVMGLGVIWGIERTSDGGIWVGSTDALMEFRAGQAEPLRKPWPFGGAPPLAMHSDKFGTLWVATRRGLLRIIGRTSSMVPLPGPPLQRISSITSDLAGGLWLSDRDRGIFRMAGRELKALILPPEFNAVQVVSSHGDLKGRVWFSFSNGRVAAVDPDFKAHLYGARDGLQNGAYRAIYEGRDGVIWFGGDQGLTKLDNGQFMTVGNTNGLPEGSIVAILSDDAGALWLGLEGIGIVRLNPDELTRALADRSYQIRYDLYDRSDGFAGAPRWFGNNTAARGEDGRLWFASARGVTIVEPHGISKTQPTPTRVSIEGAFVNGQVILPISQIRLPSRTNRIEIDYTVPNLTSPLKTRFRYRLEGFDADWIDAAARRQTFYTNLRPGQYRFQVTASNNDGTWSESNTAVWEFSISPVFYQTASFGIASIAALLVVTWGAWRLHIRRVRNQFSMLLRERSRLSREIHDTVLQGLCGVAFQCEALANDVESSAPRTTKERLLRLRRDAEEYAREARQSILSLRSPRLQRNTLAESLRQAGERASAGSRLAFKFAMSGKPSERWANADEQVLRIGQEAIINAVRHSHGTEVCVDLQYNDTSIILRVSDNGGGFDLDRVQRADGHYGLLSMKERAEAVGGTLSIASELDHGALIEAIVPRLSD